MTDPNAAPFDRTTSPYRDRGAARTPKILRYAPVRRTLDLCGEIGEVRRTPHSLKMARRTAGKITVLLNPEEFDRFDAFCRDRGFKKSTLIARLIRQYLDLEGYSRGYRDPIPPRAGRTSIRHGQ